MKCGECGGEEPCYTAVIGTNGNGIVDILCEDCTENSIEALLSTDSKPHDGCAICGGKRDYDIFRVTCVVEHDDGEIDVEYDYTAGMTHFCETHINILLPPDIPDKIAAQNAEV